MSAGSYIGLCLLGTVVFYAVKLYLDEESLMMSEYEDMLAFLFHARKSVSSFLMTPEEICASFEAKTAALRCFTERFSRSEKDGFFEKSRMMQSDKDMLKRYFSKFGMSGYDCETEELGAVCKDFEARVVKLREESKKSRKLIPVICVFAFVSLILLLL